MYAFCETPIPPVVVILPVPIDVEFSVLVMFNTPVSASPVLGDILRLKHKNRSNVRTIKI